MSVLNKINNEKIIFFENIAAFNYKNKYKIFGILIDCDFFNIEFRRVCSSDNFLILLVFAFNIFLVFRSKVENSGSFKKSGIFFSFLKTIGIFIGLINLIYLFL